MHLLGKHALLLELLHELQHGSLGAGTGLDRLPGLLPGLPRRARPEGQGGGWGTQSLLPGPTSGPEMVTVSLELWQAGTTPGGQRRLLSSQDKPVSRASVRECRGAEPRLAPAWKGGAALGVALMTGLRKGGRGRALHKPLSPPHRVASVLPCRGPFLQRHGWARASLRSSAQHRGCGPTHGSPGAGCQRSGARRGPPSPDLVKALPAQLSWGLSSSGGSARGSHEDGAGACQHAFQDRACQAQGGHRPASCPQAPLCPV